MLRKGFIKGMRAVLFCLVAVMAVWFFLPMWRGIRNIGNITGIFACIILDIYILFAPAVNQKICTFWHFKAGKVVLCVAGSLLAAAVVLTVIFSVMMIAAACRRPQQNTTVVVLGCKVNGSAPSLMLQERMTAAAAFLKEHPDVKCILSGGQGADEDISEAECMYRYMIKQGISSDRLFKEERSTSTRENLQFSFDIIKQQKLSENITIVTNEFHQYRAGKIADKLGLEHAAVNGKTAGWLFPTYYARELFGILYEYLF